MTTETAPLDVRVLRESFKAAVAADPELIDTFYRRLHDRRPDLWDATQPGPTFSPFGSRGMYDQIDKLGAALEETLHHIEDTEYLTTMYARLGRRHAALGALGESEVMAVAAALLWTLRNTLGDYYTDYLEQQWVRAYGTLIELMRAGAQQ